MTTDAERFLYLEAALLEDRDFEGWLDLFTDDCRYWVPLHERVQGIDPTVEERGMPLMDEDKAGLAKRIRWLRTGRPHVENPHSMTQRMITNVHVVASEGDRIDIRSNFLVYQMRTETQDAYHVGRRLDQLIRTHDGSLRIRRRKVLLSEPVLHRALSVFL